ncbi:putative efflux protein, MATE family [Colwellia chukchiensis]|uniref:Putative efflux protein, MATE family n=1 Tax=Colwellia chukchiensis TaxID=641665 RepID=A0A1H7MQX3_9GAMM|nr:MATE family efflux transporter [Colwellia chukchiensis]SEL13603.1 putative efflux protein, MATE family [Colwellia chukchiensis]
MSKANQSVADRSLLSLTWPIFIDLFFIFMINVTDAWFLSQISDTAAASVGAILPILGIAFALYSTLHQGGSSVASQRIGAGDFHKLATTYGVLFIILFIGGLLLTALMCIFAPTFATWMGLSDDMAIMASIYLSTIGMGTWILALRFAAAAVLTSQGKTNWNMWSTLVMTIVNIVFNYLLVDGKFGFPALGVKGVALASVTAWAVSLCFTLVIIKKHLKFKISLPNNWLKFKNNSAPILKIAMPSVLEPMSWQFTQILMTVMIVTMGEIALATRIYSFNLLFTAVLYGFAVSAGVQIKVAHYIGAKRFDDAHQQLMQGLKLGLVGAMIFVFTLLAFSEQLFAIFTDNTDIWAMGKMILWVAILGEFGRSFNLIVGASLRASGDARYVSIVGFSIMWFVAMPLAWALGLHFAYGLVGIWLAMSIDECIRGFFSFNRWQTGKWRTKGVYMDEVPVHEPSINERIDCQEANEGYDIINHESQSNKK